MTKLAPLERFAGLEGYPAEAAQAARAAEPVFVVVRPDAQNYFTPDIDRVWAPRYVTTRRHPPQRSKKARAGTLLVATSIAYAVGWYAGGLALHHSFDRLQQVVPLAQQWVQQLRSESFHFAGEPHQ